MSCLRAIHRHLAPGGRLAFEVENPNIPAMAEWITSRRGTLALNRSRAFTHPETGLRIQQWGALTYHPSRQTYETLGVREEVNDAGELVRRVYSEGELRYFHRYEMEHMLARCGFEVEALYGDTLKNPYTSRSPDFIWVAKKA